MAGGVTAGLGATSSGRRRLLRGAAGVSGAGEAGFSAFSVFADVWGFSTFGEDALGFSGGWGLTGAGAASGPACPGFGPMSGMAGIPSSASAGAAFGSSFAGGSVALLAGGFGAASLGSAAGGCSFGDFASGDLSPGSALFGFSFGFSSGFEGMVGVTVWIGFTAMSGISLAGVLDFFGSTTGLELVGAGCVELAAGWAGVTAAFALLMVRRALATTALGCAAAGGACQCHGVHQHQYW